MWYYLMLDYDVILIKYDVILISIYRYSYVTSTGTRKIATTTGSLTYYNILPLQPRRIVENKWLYLFNGMCSVGLKYLV